MEKKQYIAPMMEAAEIEVQSMMATSGNVVDVYDETTDENAKMAGERRGSWGSLWN